MWERNRRVDGVKTHLEVTPRRTVVGLVAALDDDDDAAVAAAHNCFTLPEPSQRIISRVKLGARLQIRSRASS